MYWDGARRLPQIVHLRRADKAGGLLLEKVDAPLKVVEAGVVRCDALQDADERQRHPPHPGDSYPAGKRSDEKKERFGHEVMPPS